ncbi:YCII-related domain protein [compost metagenome]
MIRGQRDRGKRSEGKAPGRLYVAPRLSHAHGRMFVIELTYTADLAEIDALMSAHMAFLRKHYAAGHFLVSGRQVPRTGGIILAVGGSRDEIEAIAREDPFCARGLARFRVIEFRASQRAADIQDRLERYDSAPPRTASRSGRGRSVKGP